MFWFYFWLILALPIAIVNILASGRREKGKPINGNDIKWGKAFDLSSIGMCLCGIQFGMELWGLESKLIPIIAIIVTIIAAILISALIELILQKKPAREAQ